MGLASASAEEQALIAFLAPGRDSLKDPAAKPAVPTEVLAAVGS
jgi:hypothetical protein